MKSSSPEQPLDIRQLQFHIGRPAVIALAGIRRDFHLAKKRIQLLGLEPSPRTHGTVARHGSRDMHQAALQRQAVAPFRHMLGEVAHERSRVDLAQQLWRFAHRHGTGAEAF